MTSTIDTLAPEISINGQALSAKQLDALTQVHIELGLCVISRTTLRLRDTAYSFSAANVFALGADVTVKLPGKSPFFQGVVTGVRLEQSNAQAPELVVIADDKAYKLLAGIKPQNYDAQTYSDVIRSMVSAAGLSADISGSRISGAATYQLRTGSALAYLDAIVRRTGIVWWCAGSKLVVRDAGDSSGTTSLSMTDDLISFSVRASALRPTTVNVTGWDLASQQQVTAAEGRSTAATRPTANFVAPYLNQVASKLVASAPNVAGMHPASQDEATKLAGALVNSAEAAAVVARGTCWVNVALTPGSTVHVSDAGPTSGDYYVSSVEHNYDRRGFTTRFVAGPFRPTGLVDTLAPAVADPGFSSFGLVIGVVTDNRDDDQHYRVKLKFPALQDSDVVSTWARVVSPGAGGARGLSFQPEIGDEVLVGFEFGDSRRPVVIGALYSPNNAMPKASDVVAEGKVNFRRMTSRLGHVVEFGDGAQPAQQHVLLQLADGNHKVRLGKDKTDVEIPSGEQLSVKAGDSSFVIDAQGNITITGQKITIKAQQDLSLEGLNVTAKAQVKLAGQGGAQLDLKGGMGNIQADGPLALKGAVVNVN